MTDIGTVLGGRYRLVELLGQGGMATIYRARDNQLERDVAVKVLRPEYGTDPDFIQRFRHEAQSAASLNHPNVVAVHDFGADPVGPFIVMELVEGEDLASIVRRSGALPPRAATRIVAQAARAVGAAHDRGFVHRDIKPGNILVTREGRVKVADFGIARALSESALTLPGTTLGSVHYFSPEQARGELASPASDIYSLGIVLYELLTGRRPWTGDTAAAIATARLTGAVPSPTSVHSGIPPALEAITRRALATSPEGRFGSAGEMADALEQVAGSAAPGMGAGTAGAAGAGTAAGVAGAATAGGAAAAAGAAGAAGAAAGAAGTATVAGVAKPNPGARVAYPTDAYAGAGTPPRVRDGRGAVDDDDEAADELRGTNPWLWVTAILAVLILALAGYLLSQLLSPTVPTTQVEVPDLVGQTFAEAQQIADEAGLEVQQVDFVQASAEVGTVVSQNPPAGELVDEGTTIDLVMAKSADLTVVPDLRNRTESEALNILIDAGLRPGLRTEAFDPVVALGSVISQIPFAGQAVVPQTPVDYIVSKGPEPSPSPTPTPVPTPTPTPVPTPTPPPPPTPTPTPAQLTVGNYTCALLALAQAQIEADGFQVGSISGSNDPASIVIAQDPAPGTLRPPGSQVNLTTQDQPVETCPPG